MKAMDPVQSRPRPDRDGSPSSSRRPPSEEGDVEAQLSAMEEKSKSQLMADLKASDSKKDSKRHGSMNGGAASSRAWIVRVLRDVRTDRCWRSALSVMGPLAVVYFLPAAFVPPAMASLPGFLYVIAVYGYISSLGSALYTSLLWAWFGIITTPILMMHAYLAAAYGPVLLFAGIMASYVLMEPLLGTKGVLVITLNTAGFILSALLSLGPAASADPFGFVMSLWQPTGALTLIVIQCVCLPFFVVIPELLGDLHLSSRHALECAAEVLEETAQAHIMSAETIRASFGEGAETKKTEKELEKMDRRLEACLKAMLDTGEKLEFMKESIGYSMYEPVMWPVGGTPVPTARWMSLYSAVDDARTKGFILLQAVSEEAALSRQVTRRVGTIPHPAWIPEMAETLESFASGLQQVAQGLRLLTGPVTTDATRVSSEALKLLKDPFGEGFANQKEKMMGSCFQANTDVFPAFCNTISNCVRGEHEEEEIAIMAAGLIELSDQVVGIQDSLSRTDLIPPDEEHKIASIMTSRNHLMVSVNGATSKSLRESLTKSAQGVASWPPQRFSWQNLCRCAENNFEVFIDTPYTIACRYSSAMRSLASSQETYFTYARVSQLAQHLAGLATLFAMNIFWTQWQALVAHSGFSAWQVASFVAILQPSAEATLKKGISGGVGVPIGGLAGLALLYITQVLVFRLPVALAITAEICIWTSLFLVTAIIVWFQPIPRSTFQLRNLADLKSAMQQGGACAVMVATTGVTSQTTDFGSALLAYVSKTSSLMVALMAAVVTSWLILPQFTYSNVRRQLRHILQQVAVQYQQLGLIYFENPVFLPPADLLRTLSSGFGALVRARTLVSAELKLKLENPLDVVKHVESMARELSTELTQAAALLKGTDAQGSSWIRPVLSCTADDSAYAAIDMTRSLLIHIEKISHLLQLDQDTYHLPVQAGHMQTYRSGIGHFEPHFCKYNELHQEIAIAYCKASRDVMTYEAQCLLLISADLLYHSPSRIDMNGGVKALKCNQKSVQELLHEVRGCMKSSRIRRKALSLRWLLNANSCIRTQAEGFEPPGKLDIGMRTSEVVANLLHEDTFSTFLFNMNRILRTSRPFKVLAGQQI